MTKVLQYTGSEEFQHIGKTHRVDDRCVLAGLPEDLVVTAGPHWYACVLGASGKGFMRGRQMFGAKPAAHECELLRTLCIRLNGEMPNDGHWVTVWNPAVDELVALYRDKDGDLQFTVDLAEREGTPTTANIDTYLQRCAEAFDQWFLLTRKHAEMRPVEGETFKRALGQAAPSSTRIH